MPILLVNLVVLGKEPIQLRLVALLPEWSTWPLLANYCSLLHLLCIEVLHLLWLVFILVLVIFRLLKVTAVIGIVRRSIVLIRLAVAIVRV